MIANHLSTRDTRRRVHVELNALNHTIGIYKTAALMKRLNIKAIRPKKKHDYPNSGDEHKYAQNLLKREFNPDSHNTHWVGDITYIRNHQGWSYLACVLDLSTDASFRSRVSVFCGLV